LFLQRLFIFIGLAYPTRQGYYVYGAFTLDVKSVLNENLGGILGGMAMLNRR
jgi:hypothetical protein